MNNFLKLHFFEIQVYFNTLSTKKKKKNHQIHTIYAMLCKIVFPLHVTLLVMITEKKMF